MKDSSGKLISLQRGVIRTNCLDCLDRSTNDCALMCVANVVQSILGKYYCYLILSKFNVNGEENKLLDRAFKEAWANTGDSISTQYAGTGALKSDFTR